MGASFDRIVPDGSGLSVVVQSIVYIFKLLIFERVMLYDRQLQSCAAAEERRNDEHCSALKAYDYHK